MKRIDIKEIYEIRAGGTITNLGDSLFTGLPLDADAGAMLALSVVTISMYESLAFFCTGVICSMMMF